MRNEGGSIESDRDTLSYRAFLVLDIAPPVSREYADSLPVQFDDPIVVYAIDTSSHLRTERDLQTACRGESANYPKNYPGTKGYGAISPLQENGPEGTAHGEALFAT